MEDATIGKNVIIKKAMIGSNAVVEDNAIIGDGVEIAVVGEYETVKEAQNDK